MGHIQRIEKNKYKILIEAGVDPSTGKRKRISKTITGTKEQAQILLAKMLNSDFNYSQGKEIKLKDYLSDWVDNYSINISERTANGYRAIIRNHLIPALGALKLSEIKPAHIIQYQQQKLENGCLNKKGGLSKRTVQSHHRLLSLALKQAVSPYGLIDSNPCSPVKAPSPKTKMANHFSREEANIILNSIDDILLYTIFYLALFTGMRRGEIVGLKWEDINFNNKLIEVRRSANFKNKKFNYKDLKTESSRRQIAISDKLIDVLKKYKKERASFSKDKQAVFLTPEGKIVRPDYLTRKFKKIFIKLGMPNKRFHDIRHTHATWLLEEGINSKIVQKRLGHARVETTLNIYSHITLDEQRKAAEKFDMTL